jgi:hypothetical protein
MGHGSNGGRPEAAADCSAITGGGHAGMAVLPEASTCMRCAKPDGGHRATTAWE